MERNYNNDFERFLKENADQYRLYPSAKVWKGIYSALHNRRRWFGLGFILLLLTGAFITLLITNSPKNNAVAYNPQPTNISPKSTSEKPEAFEIKTANQSKTKNYFSADKFSDNSNFAISYSDLAISDDHAKVSASPENISVHTDNIVLAGVKKSIKTKNDFQNKTAIRSGEISFNDELTDQNIFSNSNAQNTVNIPTQKLLATNNFNWTIESVLNSYKKITKSHKIGLQLIFSPTISYRKLSENKEFMRSAATQNVPYTFAALYDINSAVTHKPDMGLELGLTAKYALTNNFKLKAGLQFNVSRYDVKAFNYLLEVATIALNNGYGVDSFRTISGYRNFNGYNSNWLHNLYFQISIPIGAELTLIGDDKVQFGIASTIQPTYVIGDRVYLLSTDYKNYAQVPWLIRRWNANTAFETYVAYSTGKVKWQVGPQVRYQLFSSFINKYPVKENLFDFGLKVGISLNNQ
jgi:hypothetical protein